MLDSLKDYIKNGLEEAARVIKTELKAKAGMGTEVRVGFQVQGRVSSSRTCSP